MFLKIKIKKWHWIIITPIYSLIMIFNPIGALMILLGLFIGYLYHNDINKYKEKYIYNKTINYNTYILNKKLQLKKELEELNMGD